MLIERALPTSLCLFTLLVGCCGYFDSHGQEDEHCFCKLQDRIIDDCSCNVDTVDHFNNVKVYPRLRSMLTKNYFRFYRVNLKRECPFWVDDSKCAIKYCHVEACHESDIPPGLKGASKSKTCSAKKYLQPKGCDDDHNDELGYLNTTISAKAEEDFVLWQAHDDAQDKFCDINENDNDAEYVDLLLNPERYTGYKGKSAHRIWNSIYMENCFRPDNTYNAYIESELLKGMCLEKRVFYRAISGLHASINIHLCANFLKLESGGISLASPKGEWGPNVDEFNRRFSSSKTKGEGANWLANLYFLYLLELRALAKAAEYLRKEPFYTGDEAQDWDTQLAVQDLLNVITKFPDHFNESIMFSGGQEMKKLKKEFKEHFRNITRIMDCVGCDKCKLWGKLQIQGLGTALKILFDHDTSWPKAISQKRVFNLERSEIVSLINSVGRLSTSIYELDEFRQLSR
ncbi:hypothetical protein PPYR_14387 [Photinus pyralis]|uniref:Ero1-like protein n=2 Tax=Photinus pyralis TaxID=7054 RepID=A0A1Y1MUH4_PHOPY|nr:ero1-like protein [Photinus pyralis]KAB0792428.1 hypothetical protein PPYR_14387 [Photinus pyralis]